MRQRARDEERKIKAERTLWRVEEESRKLKS